MHWMRFAPLTFVYSYRWKERLKSLPPKAQLKRPFAEDGESSEVRGSLPHRTRAELQSNSTFLKASFQYGDWTIVGHLLASATGISRKDQRNCRCFFYGGRVPRRYPARQRIAFMRRPRRYSSVENLIIALRCDVSNKRLDEVLFGSQQFTIYVNNDASSTTPPPEPHQSQRMNGFWFNSSGPINRHVIGIVAYYGVRPWALDRSTAVFYSNPYLQGPMPAWTKLIHHAEYTDGEVSTSEGVPPYTFLRDYVTIGSPFG